MKCEEALKIALHAAGFADSRATLSDSLFPIPYSRFPASSGVIVFSARAWISPPMRSPRVA